jgi:hypothetical protein
MTGPIVAGNEDRATMSFAGERLFDSAFAPSMSLAKQHDLPRLWTVPPHGG